MKRLIIILCLILTVCQVPTKINLFICNIDNEVIPNSYMDEETFYQDFETYSHTPINSTDFNMIAYFKNLYDYSPKNIYGSCGYVSFIQYLSYYDTFFNDNIIPESYEYNQGNSNSMLQALSVSPGVLRNEYSVFKNVNYNPTVFKQYIENNKNIDFQMLLMYVKNEVNNWTTTHYSIGMWSYQILIDYLFQSNEVYFNYYRVQNFGLTAKPTDQNVVDFFDEYVKNQLDLGNPVLLHIANYNEVTDKYENYHSVVAYYYDENGIHAHFGWGNASADTIINSDYQITEAGVIDFANINHIHSNNYIINNLSHCGCSNNHVYNINYAPINISIHEVYCVCGKYITEDHSFDYEYFDGSGHLSTCTKCDYSYEAPHVFISNNLWYCIVCKHSVESPGFGGVIHPNSIIKKETINGSYILPNGCIVLKPMDIESYYAGSLVFYNKNQLTM